MMTASVSYTRKKDPRKTRMIKKIDGIHIDSWSARLYIIGVQPSIVII